MSEPIQTTVMRFALNAGKPFKASHIARATNINVRSISTAIARLQDTGCLERIAPKRKGAKLGYYWRPLVDFVPEDGRGHAPGSAKGRRAGTLVQKRRSAAKVAALIPPPPKLELEKCWGWPTSTTYRVDEECVDA